MLKIGFIGGGFSSAIGRTHYHATRIDGLWELKAGSFSRKPEINRKTAEEWGIESDHLYDNWQDMLAGEQDNLDAIVILTDTPSHGKIIKEALKYEYRIISEKAITDSIQSCDEISALYDKDRHFLISVFNYTGYPLLRELKAMIEHDALGKLLHIHLEMPQEGYMRRKIIEGREKSQPDWHLQDGGMPAILFDLGIHLHNACVFLTNEEPNEVFAEFGNLSPYDGLCDYAQILTRFRTGIKGHIWFTKTAIGERNGLRLRVFGDKATASWHQMEPEYLKIDHLDGRHEMIDRGNHCLVAGDRRYTRFYAGHMAGYIEAFANFYQDAANALDLHMQNKLHHSTYLYDFHQAKKGIEFFHAANESDKLGKWIQT